MREHSVPCRELSCGRHTWHDGGFCSNACQAVYEARLAAQLARRSHPRSVLAPRP